MALSEATAELTGLPEGPGSPGGSQRADRVGRATLLVALSACCFATIPIFVTLAVRSGTPLLDLLVGRYGAAAVLLAAVAWSAGTRRLEARGLRVFLVMGLLQALVAYSSLRALDYIQAGTLAFLFYTYPGWIALLARVLHSEPLTPVRLAALGLSLAGVVVMVGSPAAASLHPAGVGLALCSALLYAVYVPLIARLQRGLTPASTAAYMAAGTALVFLIVRAVSGNGPMYVSATGALSAAGLAVISTTLSFLLFLRGLAALGSVRSAIVSTIEPFATALLGAAVLAQPLTGGTLAGGALIACAVLVLQRGANPIVK